jgi:hypothetical protein
MMDVTKEGMISKVDVVEDNKITSSMFISLRLRVNKSSQEAAP